MRSEQMTADLCTHPEYDHRVDPIAFDDRTMRDEWQDAVYAYARDYAVRNEARCIVDFGCGSGYKLMKYFGGFSTIGYEIEPCLSHLRTTYPARQWSDSRKLLSEPMVGDLMICADVIEHLPNPTHFMEILKRGPLQTFVLSTPALEILAERGESPRLGPPDNRSHLREWTTREFRDFVAMHLTVLDHRVVSCAQGTQLILAELRR